MIESIDATPRRVRNFGFLFGTLGIVLACISVWKGGGAWKWLMATSVGFFTLAFVGYSVLRPLYVGWMTLAYLLAWINTRVLLGLFFYLILTPGGVILRLLGRDLLEEKIDRNRPTYWKPRDPPGEDRSRYERLF